MDAATCSTLEGHMALPDKKPLPLNTVFQRPPQEGLKGMPFYRICLCNQPKKVIHMLNLQSGFSIFTKKEEYYPHIPIG